MPCNYSRSFFSKPYKIVDSCRRCHSELSSLLLTPVHPPFVSTSVCPQPTMYDDAPFKKGDAVEVNVESDFEGSKIVTWHSATVLKSTQGTKGKVFVEFTNLTSYENTHLRERVDFCRVRPIPPPARWWFKVGDKVEVIHDYGWRRGFVLEILEQSKYLLKVDGVAEASEVDQWRVRMFREWVDGEWVPVDQENLGARIAKCSEKIEKTRRKVVVKFDGEEKTLMPKFDKGMLVEVSSDEEGYEGAYYAATVVRYLGKHRYLVEYVTLRTSDEKEALREEAESRHIRPCQPYLARIDRYKWNEVVDCWYNDGWWKGEVSKILPSLRYIVYFNTTKENLEFTHADLRPHQEWVDGRWVMDSTSKEQGRHPTM